jgi:hypothetical protein
MPSSESPKWCPDLMISTADMAERVAVFGPIVEDGTAIEKKSSSAAGERTPLAVGGST